MSKCFVSTLRAALSACRRPPFPAERPYQRPIRYGSSKTGLLVVVSVCLVLVHATLRAQETNLATGTHVTESVLYKLQQLALKLAEVSAAIDKKIVQRDALVKILSTQAESEPGVQENTLRLSGLNRDIVTLRSTFEIMALRDVDLERGIESEAPYDWRQEVVAVVAPVLDSLKSVTEKPREIAQLRETLGRHQARLDVAKFAVESITSVPTNVLDTNAIDRLNNLSEKWTTEQQSFEQRLLLTKSQLVRLENSDEPVFNNFWPGVKNFLLGRGLTILLAMGAALIVWFFLRFCWWVVNEKLLSKKVRRGSTWYRLVVYSSFLLTIVLVVLAVMFVLYLRQDLLLLALAIVVLAATAIGLRNFVPGYIREARLLLNVGPVREDERVMYNGLPWQVMSLNIQSVLRNPALEGVLRLPLDTVSELISRPVKDTLWFPTATGDYVILPGGRFGRVMTQTPEVVKLRVKGGMAQTIPSNEFYAMKVINVSAGETFGVAVTFGLDYSHQKIALSDIPVTLKAAIVKKIEQSDYTGNIVDVMVELNSAAASSLDYLVYLTVNKELAGSYYGLRRLVLHTCIEVANQQNWIIPFPQLMLHRQQA